MARILGSVLGVLFAFIMLIVILQIFEIKVLDLLLPILAFLLPLVFIFGRSVRVLWESFMVLFIMKPWKRGDYIVSSGKSFFVDNMTLYTSSGYTLENVWVAVPNAWALSNAIENYGRAKPGRLRVYFRVDVEQDEIRPVFDSIVAQMKHYCGQNRGIFKKNGFSAWIANSDYNDTEFDDLRATTYCVNAALLHVRKGDLAQYRKVKTAFLEQIHVAVRGAGGRAVGGKAIHISVDASSPPEPLPIQIVDL